MITIHDAADIIRPLSAVPDRPLDPPTAYWTDANERDYAAWLESRRAEMEHEFALDRDDAFDEFCRDKFEEECL